MCYRCGTGVPYFLMCHRCATGVPHLFLLQGVPQVCNQLVWHTSVVINWCATGVQAQVCHTCFTHTYVAHQLHTCATLSTFLCATGVQLVCNTCSTFTCVPSVLEIRFVYQKPTSQLRSWESPLENHVVCEIYSEWGLYMAFVCKFKAPSIMAFKIHMRIYSALDAHT